MNQAFYRRYAPPEVFQRLVKKKFSPESGLPFLLILNFGFWIKHEPNLLPPIHAPEELLSVAKKNFPPESGLPFLLILNFGLFMNQAFYRRYTPPEELPSVAKKNFSPESGFAFHNS